MSMDAVDDIPDNSLDFVFIDANHAFDYVMLDLIYWTKKVRPGGIVSGDDYFHFKKAGVVEAVDAYTKAHGITFELTDPLTNKIRDRNSQEQPVFYWTK
jgi:predicted O-methyltransferase YrrM